MISINELTPLTNITRKQINNRLIPLVNRYPNLITGGGRGKRGRYSIHPLLIKYLTHYKPYTSLEDIKMWDEIQSEYLKIFPPINKYETFKMIEWSFFGCYSPPNIDDSEQLINLIPIGEGDMVFYSIHSNRNTKDLHTHIHFAIQTNKPIKEIITPNLDLNQKRIKVDVKVEEFDKRKSDGCFKYLNNLTKDKDSQYVVENGYIMGLKGRKGIKKVFL